MLHRIEQIRSQVLQDMRQNNTANTNTTSGSSARSPHVPTTIVPSWLYVSGSMGAKNKAFLTRHGIRHILNCADERSKGTQPPDCTVCYLELGARDEEGYELLLSSTSTTGGATPTPTSMMLQAHTFLQSTRGEPVLVHCSAGLNRSVAIVVSYVLRYGLCKPTTTTITTTRNEQEDASQGLLQQHNRTSLEDAVRLVFRERPFALSNQSFVRQLIQLEAFFKEQDEVA